MKMAKKRRGQRESERTVEGIDAIGEDVLQNILSRLPALSFASAACVSRSWNKICKRVLSRPKLTSALSLKSSEQEAVHEVLEKVLSEPIRPHFAIAYIGPSFNSQLTHYLINKKLGSRIPVITSMGHGIIGRDASSNDFKEIQWQTTVDDETGAGVNSSVNRHCGIVLTVGYVPGLKVAVVPLLRSVEGPPVFLVDDFVTNIREYTTSVSGCTSPAGIIMFGDQETDMKPILDKMDYAMSKETVIVGDAGCQILYGGRCVDTTHGLYYTWDAGALLFVRDRDKPHGVGETCFHMALSSGVSSIGPIYKADSVRERRDEFSTWLTAKREGSNLKLDGGTLLDTIYDEMGDRSPNAALYIGVTKRRKCSIGLEKVRWITSQEFHEVQEGDDEYLYVNGTGIRTGDSFHFYFSDSGSALSSCNAVSNNLRRLKQDCDHEKGVTAYGKKEVFGGLIFSCCGRGESFFGHPNVDSTPFLENFPEVTLSGTFSAGEIGRGDSHNESSVRCCLHVFSTVYLIMSYTPALPDQ
ncbi:unnamed protein product [Ilex paraguariensis]|uniref:F-box/LRR-repeat protein n=1 Tax=Ilex paraguariensis TaxID=185542 RepID=A0ABC8UQ53_9AQUA